MKKYSYTIFLFAILMVAVTACQKTVSDTYDKTEITSESNQTAITESDTGEIDYVSELSTDYFDGYDFRILVRKDKISDQYLAEDSDDPVQSAIYKRNKTVEERYGITITATESSSSDYETDALNSILAGDDAYDIIFAHSRAAFSYAVQGAVLNANDVPTIHLEKPWWSKDIKNSCDIGGKLYVLDGDISMHRLHYAMCMVFNKRIFDELGYDYPYQMVKDGEWTFDEFAYLAKKGSADLNGDGVMDPDNDQYGYYTTAWEGPVAFLYIGGGRIYDKNDEGVLELTLYSNKTAEIYDRFFNLTDSDGIYLDSGLRGKRVSNFFNEGRAMFADSSLGSAKALRNMDDDFGIVPYPKFTKNDAYATIVNGHAHLAVIPITVSDPERTGAIIEALCAYGSRDVLPAFYDVSLKTKYARDDESEDMMDIIRDSIIYDIGYVSGGTFQSTGYDLANSVSHDFSSYYASRETAAKQKLKEFNRDYAGVE